MKRRKKLRKMGFDPEELSKQNTIRMNKENFQRIAEQQLKNTQIFLPNDIPRLERMKSFKDKLKLSQKIYSAMAHYEIEEPTPIQQIAIPYITDSDCDNMVIQAQTGSGKTHAFILPIIDYVIQAKSNDRHYTANATSPHAIIVAPTKELTVQLACDATRLIPDMNWHVGISFSFGGQDPRDANKMLNAGCDILILTPGRLFDYFGEHDRSNVCYIRYSHNLFFSVAFKYAKFEVFGTR
jgi:superfamily II DNA/RNA helicase